MPSESTSNVEHKTDTSISKVSEVSEETENNNVVSTIDNTKLSTKGIALPPVSVSLNALPASSKILAISINENDNKGKSSFPKDAPSLLNLSNKSTKIETESILNTSENAKIASTAIDTNYSPLPTRIESESISESSENPPTASNSKNTASQSYSVLPAKIESENQVNAYENVKSFPNINNKASPNNSPLPSKVELENHIDASKITTTAFNSKNKNLLGSSVLPETVESTKQNNGFESTLTASNLEPESLNLNLPSNRVESSSNTQVSKFTKTVSPLIDTVSPTSLVPSFKIQTEGNTYVSESTVSPYLTSNKPSSNFLYPLTNVNPKSNTKKFETTKINSILPGSSDKVTRIESESITDTTKNKPSASLQALPKIINPSFKIKSNEDIPTDKHKKTATNIIHTALIPTSYNVIDPDSVDESKSYTINSNYKTTALPIANYMPASSFSLTNNLPTSNVPLPSNKPALQTNPKTGLQNAYKNAFISNTLPYSNINTIKFITDNSLPNSGTPSSLSATNYVDKSKETEVNVLPSSPIKPSTNEVKISIDTSSKNIPSSTENTQKSTSSSESSTSTKLGTLFYNTIASSISTISCALLLDVTN